jgi:uncharacterized protein YkwD
MGAGIRPGCCRPLTLHAAATDAPPVADATGKPTSIRRGARLREIGSLAVAAIGSFAVATVLMATAPALASAQTPGRSNLGAGKSAAVDRAGTAGHTRRHGSHGSPNRHRRAGTSGHKRDHTHGSDAKRHAGAGHRHGSGHKRVHGVSHTARHGTHAVRKRRDVHSPQAAPTSVPQSRTASSTSTPSGQVVVCSGAGLTPTPENVEAVREATVCLINNERIAHGERPLQLNTDLANCAQGHSESMAVDDYFSHEGPGGTTPLSRMQAAGYIDSSQIGYEIGENIAWGTLWLATPKSIVESWMQSPEHRANILDANYRETGIGVSPHAPIARAEGQPGALYTQDFGVIITG